MSWWRALALLALTLAVPARPAAAGHDPDAGPLPWRVGGKLGFTVDAATFPDSAGLSLEVYVRLPRGTLDALADDTLGVSHARLTVTLKNSYGSKNHQAVQEFAIAPADTMGGFGKVVVMRFPVRSGKERVNIRLEDLRAMKKGLRILGGGRPEFAAADGMLDIPGPQAGRDMSDLEFVWDEGPSAESTAFQRGPRAALPNPERLYGLFETDLRAAFAARAADAKPWSWVARVLDRDGKLVAQRESTAAAAPRLDAAALFDITQQPAGGYDLEVKAWQEGDAGALLRRAHFSIAWKRDSWLRNPRDIEDPVHFLLTAEAEDSFAVLHPGEQERYLDEFWKVRDPTPETAENEALNTFLERVAHANAIWGRGTLIKGIFSDMGRTYIRYGQPDEVYHEVIPAGNETLLEAVRALSLSEDRPIGDVGLKAWGGETRPYEVWIYEHEQGLPPDADPRIAQEPQRRRRLVFLFVDEQGLGDYRLRYSTE